MHTRIDGLPMPLVPRTTDAAPAPASAKDAESLKLQKVSEEFESLLLHEMIKSMRAADSFLTDDEAGGGSQNLHREMLDEQLARNMARGGGLGLARVLEQQMQRRLGEGTP